MYCAYLRKSTDREDMQVDSIPAQKEWVAKIEEMTNKKVIRIFEDKRSALIPNNRPSFTELINELEAGIWAGVIVISIDRLARNMPEGGRICYALQTGKVKEIYTALGTFTPESDTISMAVHFGQATQTSRNISFKSKAGMIRKAKMHKKWMWVAPLGYKNTQDPITKEKFVVPDDSFPLVKEIFRLRLEGKSAPYIANVMKEKGLMTKPTKKRKATLVETRNIYSVLNSPFYCGLTKAEGEWLPGEWEPAISLEDFPRLPKKQKLEIKTEVFYPFRGMIRCGECDTAITSEIKKGISYYHCNGRKSGCHQKKYYREDELDSLFAKLLSKYQLTNDFKERIKKAIEELNESSPYLIKNNNSKILKRLNELEDEKKQQVRMRGREEISFEMMQETLKDIDRESKQLQAEISKGLEFTRSQAHSANMWIELLKNLSASYKSFPYPLKQFILKMLGSNYVIKDGILALQSLGEGFESLKKTANSDLVTQTVHQSNQLAKECALDILKNIDKIETILTHLGRIPA